MIFPKCCGNEKDGGPGRDVETIRIERTQKSCKVCEKYTEEQKVKPVAVVCCEGACLRGEIARRTANLLCHELAPAQTARICLGSAFTKESGQRDLVRNASRVLVLEGCHVNCASRMMDGAISGLKFEVIGVSQLCDFDKSLFGLNEMDSAAIDTLAQGAARQIVAQL